MNVQILGHGAFGSAIGSVLQQNGHDVLWTSHGDDKVWRDDPHLVVLAIPSRFLLETLRQWSPPPCPVVSLAKGIEPQTDRRVSELVWDEWKIERFAVISGPSFASGVAKGQPTAVVAACANDDFGREVQAAFHRPVFRVYRSTDVAGVELGGALKNVFAIAAGISAGLGFGDNTLAALISRGLAEMVRLGTALGGRMETFMGLSGVGDLMLTCYGPESRNRRLGEALGRGLSRDAALASLGGIAEGYTTVAAVRELAQRLGLPAPLTEQVHAVLYEDKPPHDALQALLTREPGIEHPSGPPA
jgi:glycerol-3-phosphate dehydrogenase (NAD(P)+)